VFVGGLLHDMGISVMHRYFRPEFKRIMEITRETDLTYLEAEESVLGVSHGDIGGWLAERWNLPDHLVEAIMYHHDPTKATKNSELVALIHCADIFSSRISDVPVEFEKGVEFDPAALDRLHLNDESVLSEFLTTYTSLIKMDLEQVTRLDLPVNDESGHHERRVAKT
jgi:HD-like signal output (HDOD) protein